MTHRPDESQRFLMHASELRQNSMYSRFEPSKAMYGGYVRVATDASLISCIFIGAACSVFV